MRAAPILLALGLALLSGCAKEKTGEPSGESPPAASPSTTPLAGKMTPERAAFAAAVDRACATTFNPTMARQDRIYAIAEKRGWIERKTEALAHENWARNQAALHRLTGELGRPPAKARLFQRWRENVALRGRLFHEASLGWAQGRGDRTNRARIRISRLKVDSDRIGQRFGLRVCTSQAPDRASDPLLRERREHAYLARLSALCRRRNQQETRLKERGLFNPNAAIGVRIRETRELAQVRPTDASQYALRDRILAIKEAVDREGRRALQQAVGSEDPGAAYDRLVPDLVAHAERAQRQLASLGLNCPPWG